MAESWLVCPSVCPSTWLTGCGLWSRFTLDHRSGNNIHTHANPWVFLCFGTIFGDKMWLLWCSRSVNPTDHLLVSMGSVQESVHFPLMLFETYYMAAHANFCGCRKPPNRIDCLEGKRLSESLRSALMNTYFINQLHIRETTSECGVKDTSACLKSLYENIYIFMNLNARALFWRDKKMQLKDVWVCESACTRTCVWLDGVSQWQTKNGR